MTSSTRNHNAMRRTIFVLGASLVGCLGWSQAQAQTPTPTPSFHVHITTSRGCLETGDHPVYLIGEAISVSFRIDSTAVSSAGATLVDRLPNGGAGVASLGQVATNATYSFGARIAPPTGVETLELKATSASVPSAKGYCSFIVAGSTTPAPTSTPRATRTPTPTYAATATPVASFTPAPNALSPMIRTNRGCIEAGDDAVFAIGETILISFNISSHLPELAVVSIWDTLPNGQVNDFPFGLLSTNANYRFRGRIAPPTGVERLQLRARRYPFGSGTATNDCSFRVVSSLPATPTRTTTATPTATATATATATP